MKVITESYLRMLRQENKLAEFQPEKGQIVTPSAQNFLRDNQGEPAYTSNKSPSIKTAETPSFTEATKITKKRSYISAFDGGSFAEKPEHMTALRGNLLIPKDHPSIIFRGKLDSFQSTLLLFQAKVKQQALSGLFKDLDDVLVCVRTIMRADVLEEKLQYDKIIGLSSVQLRQISHKPKEHFATEHLLPSAEMGQVILELNSLRSNIREVEIAAISAFRREFDIERSDIIEVLNRLSSALYIMMLKEHGKKYQVSKV